MKYFFLIVVLFCLTFSVKAQSVQEDVSLSQNPTSKVELFPNPTIDFLTVRLEGVSVRNLNISLRNIIGNEMPLDVEYLAENEFKVKVKDFGTGYYLIAMQDEKSGFKGTYKFIKR
jgi:hypothetical protein